jgi:hypothetical protein
MQSDTINRIASIFNFMMCQRCQIRYFFFTIAGTSRVASAISNIFALDTTLLLSLFYGTFLLIIFFYMIKNRYLFAISNAFFVIISLVTLIIFFGTYIYELPSHHCPFCFLQSDYYFVGYLIYALLFMGTFYGLVVGFIEYNKEDRDKSYKKSLIFNTLYVILLSSFVMIYFIKNGVWL